MSNIALKEPDAKIEFHEGSVKREDILAFESILAQTAGATHGDAPDMPLKHSFGDGVYVREIFIPKGTMLTGKIHKHKHPNFLMKGEVLVVTEKGGREHLKAPMSMISEAGTKRVIYAIEDTVWVTVHVTGDTDLQKIEDHVIAPTFEDYEKFISNEKVLKLEKQNCLILALKSLNRDVTPLLSIEPDGYLLPLKKCMEKLKEARVSMHGIYISPKEINGTLHAQTEGGIPLLKFEATDTDMVGTWVAVAVGGGALVGGIGGAAINTFGKKDVEQKPMVTDQQKSAQQALLNFGNTGITPYGLNVRDGFQGKLGNYDISGLENSAMGKIASNLSGGPSSTFQSGTGFLKNFLDTNNFDPNAGGVYSGLTAGMDFNQGRAIDAAKAGGAFQGNLYSQNMNRNIGDITAQTSNAKSGILANLYQNYTNQKLQASGQAIQAGTAEQNINQNQATQALVAGALPRTLADQQAKDAYQAWVTQRGQDLMPMQSLSNVAGMNANYGVTSVPTPSPWADLLKTLTTTGAYLAGSGAFSGSGSGTTPGNNVDMTQMQNQYQWGA